MTLAAFTRKISQFTAALAWLSLPVLFVLQPGYTQERDLGPDKTVYVRPATADDFINAVAPAAQMNCAQGDAFSSCTLTDIVSTDKAQNMRSDSLTEPSIAINPKKCNGGGDKCSEFVITTIDAVDDWSSLPICKDSKVANQTCAPLWRSTDGGTSWTKLFQLPPPPGITTGNCPCDSTLDYLRDGTLTGTFLLKDKNVYTGTTADATDWTKWQWRAAAAKTQKTNMVGTTTDQPWILVNPSGLQDMIYVGYDKTQPSPQEEARVAVSSGMALPDFKNDNSAGNETNGGVLNPGLRMTGDGGRMPYPIYTIFQLDGNIADRGTHTVSYVLNRSKTLGLNQAPQIAWPLGSSSNGCDDADPKNPLTPCIISKHKSDQPGPSAQDFKFGAVNALKGGIDHIATDPGNGDIYAVYGDRDAATGSNTLEVLRMGNNGKGGIKGIGGPTIVTPTPVQAALPSIAVTSNGTVGVLYDTFDGCSKSDVKTDPTCTGNAATLPVFTAHLALSTDHAQTFTDYKLVKFLAPMPHNNQNDQRELGDFQQLRAVGNTFYGSFSANGAVFARQCGGAACAISDVVFLKAVLK